MDYKLISRVLKLAQPYRKLMLICIVLGLLLAPISSIRPYVINRIVDDSIAQFDINGLFPKLRQVH